jgi:hypothetical protein
MAESRINRKAHRQRSVIAPNSNNYAALRPRRTANDPDLILIHLNHDLIWLPDEASVQMALGRPAIVQNPTPGSSKVARWLCYDKVYQLMGWLLVPFAPEYRKNRHKIPVQTIVGVRSCRNSPVSGRGRSPNSLLIGADGKLDGRETLSGNRNGCARSCRPTSQTRPAPRRRGWTLLKRRRSGEA